MICYLQIYGQNKILSLGIASLFIGQHFLNLRHIGNVGHSGLAQNSLTLCGLFVQNMGFERVTADHFAVLGNFEALFRAGMRLNFRHNSCPSLK
jgi:hypothetical protein